MYSWKFLDSLSVNFRFSHNAQKSEIFMNSFLCQFIPFTSNTDIYLINILCNLKRIFVRKCNKAAYIEKLKKTCSLLKGTFFQL